MSAPRTLEEVAGGDPAALRQLRANLASIARQSEDPDTRDLIREVLAGRGDFYAVTRTPDFERLGERHLDNLFQGMARLEPEEREEFLVALRPAAEDEERPEPTPDADLAALRDAAGPSDGWASEDAARPDERRDRLR